MSDKRVGKAEEMTTKLLAKMALDITGADGAIVITVHEDGNVDFSVQGPNAIHARLPELLEAMAKGVREKRVNKAVHEKQTEKRSNKGVLNA